jgi:hypothetical protein
MIKYLALILITLSQANASQIPTKFIQNNAVTAAKIGSGAATAGQVPSANGSGGTTYTDSHDGLLGGYTIGTLIQACASSDSIIGCLQKLAGNQRLPEYDDGNSSTADTIDWANGNAHKSTATGNCTYTFSNPINGQAYILKIVNDGTVRTITWPSTVKWPGGTAPTLTGTNTHYDLINFYWDGTNYLGSSSLNYTP